MAGWWKKNQIKLSIWILVFHTFNHFFNVVSNSHLTNLNCIALANYNNLRSKNLILIILRPWAASRVLKLHRRSVVVQRLLLPSQMTPNISPQFIEKSISRLQHQSFKKHTHRDMLEQNVTLTFPSIYQSISCLHREV